MLICTPNRTLHVLQIMQQTQRIVTYVCTDMAEDDPRSYLLNGFLQAEVYQNLIPLILEQKNAYFTDFIESFSADGIFYLLFRYQEGVPLLRQCKHAEMEQRLEYTRCLIEQMVLQDMPLLFQYAVLLPDRIWLTENKQVQFYYQLPDTLGQEAVSFHDVELRLLELVKQLLYHELEMQYSDCLLDFCKALRDGGVYCDYAAIYAAFSGVNQELNAQKGHLVSKKYRFQLWEACKKHSQKIRRCLVLLIIAASAALLFYETFGKSGQAETDTQLTQIGTLVIRENQPAVTTTAVTEETK